jgi:ArsR family transcriptional regulator, arsenate/arsenite/antimonite-responsive transcriptional repressor
MDVDHAFDALADPVRREILVLLADYEECSAGELSERVSRVGRTAVSSHLRKLLTAGLITERRTGRFRYYSLNPNGTARDVLTLLQTLFQDSLAEAKRTAEATAAVHDIRDRVG